MLGNFIDELDAATFWRDHEELIDALSDEFCDDLCDTSLLLYDVSLLLRGVSLRLCDVSRRDGSVWRDSLDFERCRSGVETLLYSETRDGANPIQIFYIFKQSYRCSVLKPF